MPPIFGIGLYMNDDHIRVVKLRRSNRGIVLERMGEISTPTGAISGGAMPDAKLLAEGIRKTLKSYDIKGNSAVAGLPGRAASSRVLELPYMSKEELRVVVAGEMEHYRMIPPGQGTFDFAALGEPTEDENRKVKLLLMAADKRVVDSYRDALRLAGLQLSVLEPYLLAASRAAYALIGQGGVAVVAMGPRSTEVAIFDNGVLRYSRQIDTGVLNLTIKEGSGKLDLSKAAKAKESAPQAPAETAFQMPQLPKLEATGSDLQSLVYELQRSIDFHHREEPGAARIGSMILCVDVDQVSGLEGYLQRALNLPVTLCDPFKGILFSDTQFNPEYLNHVGPAFAPAVGLALRALEEVPQAPSLDLSVTGAESRMAKSAPRRLVWALGISICLVIVTAFASFSLGRVLRQRQDDLNKAKAELAIVTQLEQESTTAARRAKEAQAIVQVRGLPWSDILFQLSEFRPKEVWFANLSTDSSNLLSLTGDAFSPDSVATLMDSLTRSELFSMPRMSYIQKDTSKSRPLVKFQIKVQVTPPKPPPAVAPATAAGPASTSPKSAGGTQ